MSLGHLMATLLPLMSFCKVDVIAIETISEMANWCRASIFSGRKSFENVRFFAGYASHVFPRCPRPAVCSIEATAVPCLLSDAISARLVLVERVDESFLNVGIVFIVSK